MSANNTKKVTVFGVPERITLNGVEYIRSDLARNAIDVACKRENAFATAVLAVRHYAETHPRPVQVNQQQAAEMLGLSVPTIRKLVRAGTLKLNSCGLILVSQIDALLEER